MPKGGARSRSGPAPDPNALRRERDGDEWITLPATGRADPAPSWPLTPASDREATLWADLWKMPQALEWEHAGQALLVALYVRRLAEAEQPESSVALSTLCRQMADGLGLTTPGMRANRWKLGEVQADAPAATSSARQGSARSRLRVVGDAVEVP